VLSIVEVVICLEYASFLPFIYFQHFVEFVMFPSISEIQPWRVSWGDNINWHCCRGEEIEARLPWENETVLDFDDRQGPDAFLVVIIYLATPVEQDQPLVTPHCSPSLVCEACLVKSSEITS